MRVIYMGTPDFAVPALRSIIAAGHDMAAVYTQPPRAAGRGMNLRKSPVHLVAEAVGVAVETPDTLRAPDAQARFAAYAPDIAVVAAYGLLLPQPILDAPRHGCLNLHASLLPRWRGAAPIHRAVMAGDAETGVMVMRMDAGLDTGPVCLTERIAIGPDMTTGELHDALAAIAADLAPRALQSAQSGTLDCAAQPDEGATYARKLDNHESRIDWRRPAREVHNLIRGLSPWPGAWFVMETDKGPERVKALVSRLAEGEGAPGEVLDASFVIACGGGAIEVVRAQRAGRKPMNGAELLRGLAPGARSKVL
jgi:methionyl-tRNA formyltransferase